MSSIADLRARISACSEEISNIQTDIQNMKNIMSENDSLRYNYTALWGRINKYDLTAGDTWKKNLTDEAESYKSYILEKIEDIRSQTWRLHNETYQATLVAQQKIDDLTNEITNLENQIREIEEQERLEEERQRAAANSRNRMKQSSR